MPHPLLTPHTLSTAIQLQNKVVMAPMTRRCSNEDGTPSDQSIAYYEKRSDAGLIITEGTLICEDAIGYGNVPGLYTKEQVASWKKITSAVHQQGGKIFVQLWHCGRVSHPHFHCGRHPISASATRMHSALGNSGFQCGWSREATHEEIHSLIEHYKIATQNAIKAGFDGVEIHAANGYLIDQFLHHCTNQRSDCYGQTPENMARFCLDVVNACHQVIGAERLGLRLSPGGHMAEIITNPDDKNVFIYLLSQLSKIAYVHTGSFDDNIIYPELDKKTMTQFIRAHYQGNVIASGGYSKKTAEDFIQQHDKNLVSFGRPFIANPQLMNKIQNNSPWTPYEKSMLNSLI